MGEEIPFRKAPLGDSLILEYSKTYRHRASPGLTWVRRCRCESSAPGRAHPDQHLRCHSFSKQHLLSSTAQTCLGGPTLGVYLGLLQCPVGPGTAIGGCPQVDRANRPQPDLPHLYWHKGSVFFGSKLSAAVCPSPGPFMGCFSLCESRVGWGRGALQMVSG